MDSIQALVLQHNLAADDIAAITINMSDKEAYVVDNRDMPAVNLQYLVAVMILDRTVSFASAHDEARVDAPAIAAIKERVRLQPDTSLPRRQPVIQLELRDGRALEHRTTAVRGTPDNPMDQQEVGEKAFDLLSGPLGDRKARALIDRVWDIEAVADVRDLRPFLMPD